MKHFVVKTLVLILRILYAPMKLRKTKNRIVWLSRQSGDKSLDVRMLSQYIYENYPETEQVFRLRHLKGEHDITLSYAFSLLKDMWVLASAQVAVTDTYSIALSCLKHKKDLRVIQIWHALGAIKKFGLQSVGKAQGRDAGISEWMCMHKNYDWIIAPSAATAKYYTEAFGYGEENIKIASLPRVDVILDGSSRREEFLKLNPQYKGKQLLLYLPTFRNSDFECVETLSDAFKKASRHALVVSLHPLTKKKFEKPISFYEGDFSTYDLMKIADGIITDYSASAFEGSLLGKPMWFYLPDFETYLREQGINTDVTRELPDACFFEAKTLLNAVESESYDFQKLSAFTDKFVENKGTNNTESLASFICSFIRSTEE